MTKNVGGIDRILRVVFGIVFIVFGVIQGGAWWALAAFGAVLIFTSVTSFCGLYTALGINTRK
jgi:uncharacterized membrane protein YecN with MAPEG domain